MTNKTNKKGWERKTKKMKRSLTILLALMMVFGAFLSVEAANEKTVEVPGTVYEYGKDGKYDFSSPENKTEANGDNTYGIFSINALIEREYTESGIPAYVVDKGNITLELTYTDKLLKAGTDDWHLVEDKSKKIDSTELKEKIKKGAVLVQTSRNRTNWVTVKEYEDFFASSTSTNVATLYTTQDIELINGCYYRVIIAYQLEKRTEEKWGLIPDKYDVKKYAEVYEFYACTSAPNNEYDPAQTYNIGKAVLVDQFDGYFGEKEIEKDDPHYNVTIGQFFVSGYTEKNVGEGKDPVFLKNVGDRVTLWFKLNENIDAIGGNPKIKVTSDIKGSDQYFQTPPTDFGRGALIIRYTDYNHNATDPLIYTNYLEANVSVGADTQVSLFEEGDYEVALDYELTQDKIGINPKSHYRIFFKFSIRNGNCMVYPFDLATGAELTQETIAEKGFRLDLAKSRYLKINVKREMLTNGKDGLTEDTRFNGPAKDGEEYTQDGIYTITVINEYTKQQTEKKIYVGTNPVLLAHFTTGIDIKKINQMVSEGAIINPDGTITIPVQTQPVTEPETLPEPVNQETAAETQNDIDTSNETDDETEKSKKNGSLGLTVGVGGGIIAVAAAAFLFVKKRGNTKNGGLVR